jgi:hypothetical protein
LPRWQQGTHGFAGNGPNYNVNPNAGAGTDLVVIDDPVVELISMQAFAATPQNNRRPLFPLIPFSLDNYYGTMRPAPNAFEVKVDNGSQGLQFLSHYTYARAYNNDNNYYAIDHNISWGPVDFNGNHVFVFNTVYELPFGKGKRFMGDAGRAMDYLMGGWQISTTNWSSDCLDA